MIELIVAPATVEEPEQYRLPAQDRREILSRSDTAIVYAEIERQREAFIEKYGDPFGPIFDA